MTPTFWTLDKETRRKHYDRSVQAGDVVRPTRDPLVWTVTSDTLTKQYGFPVRWRVNIQTGACGCPANQQRGCCRHAAAAIMAAWEARQQMPDNVVPFRHAA